MRNFLWAALLVGVLTGLAIQAHAQDVRVIIERAVQAHGGAAKLDRYPAGHIKSKGTLYVPNAIPVQFEALRQLPSQMKQVSQIDSNGQKINLTMVFNGDRGWINANGKTREMDAKEVAHTQQEMYVAHVLKLTNLMDRAFELSPLPEINVEGRAAVGVKVASRGHPDVKLYFDKASNLLVKTENRTLDQQSGVEVSEERVISDYRDMDGLKLARRLAVYRDGKKFMDAEVTDAKFLEKVDPAEFGKP